MVCFRGQPDRSAPVSIGLEAGVGSGTPTSRVSARTSPFTSPRAVAFGAAESCVVLGCPGNAASADGGGSDAGPAIRHSGIAPQQGSYRGRRAFARIWYRR